MAKEVLLYNSQLRLFPRKLKSRWAGPFTVVKVYPYGTIELQHPENGNFKVNGQRSKWYLEGEFSKEKSYVLLEKPKLSPLQSS